jgi:3-oxoacyl-[acyl-carrier-protein] synthase-3
MTQKLYSVITGSGSYVPPAIVKNDGFMENSFFNVSGDRNPKSNQDIISKFAEITEIEERRYVDPQYVNSDIATFAAREAIKSASIDPETLDYIVVAHNFGDITTHSMRTEMLPSLAAKVKHNLKIENPYTVAFDLPFGCPGWVQGLIHADYFIKSGDAKKILVIGSETLSRVCDPHDIDSMIYSDGAGAVVLEAKESDQPIGILSHISRSDTLNHAWLLKMGPSYNPDKDDRELFLKMEGRKVYEYALTNVPPTVKLCIEKAGIGLEEIKKVLIHQANAKMDHAILKRLFRLFGVKELPENIMPLTIATLGNNSVATIPILYDLLIKKELDQHHLSSGDHFVFTSVGAGMNINAVVYRIP